MPVPIVIVDVAAESRASPEAVTALVEACNEAYSHGRCEIDSSRTSPGRRVRLRWSTDFLHARVDLPSESRELSFATSDDPVERWRAVGLVIGTLADDAEPPPAPVAPPRVPPPTVAEPIQEPRLPRTWTDVGVVAGPAGDGWRAGGSLRGAHVVMEPVFALLAMRYAVRPVDDNGVTLGWFTPSIGIGVHASPEPSVLDLDLRLEGIAELARATAAEGDRQSSDSRWALGGRVGGDAGLRLTPELEIEIGGDVSYTGHPIELRTGGQLRETLGAASFAFLGGVRWVLR